MIATFTLLMQSVQSRVRPVWQSAPWLPILLLSGLTACNTLKGDGAKQRIRLMVGEIREIPVPNRGDGFLQLIGTSDNQEVVEVSRPELAPAVDTLKRNTRPAVFQLKGVTVGTANVVFTEKQPTDSGSGQIKKTYVVQVISR